MFLEINFLAETSFSYKVYKQFRSAERLYLNCASLTETANK